MRRLVRFILAAVALAAFTHASASDYVFTYLDTPAGGRSGANAVNSLGQVVGYTEFTIGNDTFRHATLWSAASVVDLHGPFDGHSEANGINDVGQIVGVRQLTATLWSPGGTGVALDAPAGISVAQDINNAGTIVGRVPNAGTGTTAAVWIGGAYSTLSEFGGGSGANTINQAGLVGGVLYSFPAIQTGAVWSGAGRTDYPEGVVEDINDQGAMAGTQIGRAGLQRALLWEAGSTTPIYLTPSINDRSQSRAINNAGQVVGSNNGRATMWFGGASVDLTSLVDTALLGAGWSLAVASDINDNGIIVGTASNGSSFRAFVLTPASMVPEPGTGLLMLAGLVVALARRPLASPR